MCALAALLWFAACADAHHARHAASDAEALDPPLVPPEDPKSDAAETALDAEVATADADDPDAHPLDAGPSWNGVQRCGVSSNAGPLLHGLVAHYRMTGNADDSAEHRVHGVLHGGTPVADALGAAGNAVEFDGQDDYAVIPENAALELESFTLSLVLKVPATRTQNWVLSRGLRFGNFTVYVAGTSEFWPSTASYVHQIPGDGNYSIPLSPTALDPEHFIALAVVIDATEQRTYVTTYANGALVAGPNQAERPNAAPAPLYLGAGGYEGAPTAFFKGTLDDVRIYDRPLRADEVKALHCPRFEAE